MDAARHSPNYLFFLIQKKKKKEKIQSHSFTICPPKIVHLAAVAVPSEPKVPESSSAVEDQHD